jgi:hypothetical protein
MYYQRKRSGFVNWAAAKALKQGLDLRGSSKEFLAMRETLDRAISVNEKIEDLRAVNLLNLEEIYDFSKQDSTVQCGASRRGNTVGTSIYRLGWV